MKHINLTCYEGVENLGRFSKPNFEKYCDDKLKSCDKHLDFLKEHFPARPLRVLEIGSGSGKLLFRLEREGMLEHGVGFEVSRSRCLFAEKFSEYCQSVKVVIQNEDFLEANLYDKVYDVVIGIDVVTNLIGAISEDHINKMLNRAKSCLSEEGGVVLEFMTCEREMNFIRQTENQVYRPWKRFDESDPFRFGLDELSFNHHGNVVWEKNFISKKGEFETFTNILRPFTRTTVSNLSRAFGLSLELFESWAHADDTLDEEFIAVFRPAN